MKIPTKLIAATLSLVLASCAPQTYTTTTTTSGGSAKSGIVTTVEKVIPVVVRPVYVTPYYRRGLHYDPWRYTSYYRYPSYRQWHSPYCR